MEYRDALSDGVSYSVPWRSERGLRDEPGSLGTNYVSSSSGHQQQLTGHWTEFPVFSLLTVYLSVITGQAALESRIDGPAELPGLQVPCSSVLGRICSEWEGEGTPLTQEVSSDHKVPCPKGGHADLEIET